MTHKIQIDDLVRNATVDEAARIQAQHAEAQAQADAAEAKQVARLALLARLGITESEAKLLLG
jgi:hypothetical protein